MNHYYVNGVKTPWQAMIALANSCGQFRDPSLKTTREAAEILRAAGYRVNDNELEVIAALNPDLPCDASRPGSVMHRILEKQPMSTGPVTR